MEWDFYRDCTVTIVKARSTDEFFPMENFFSEQVDYYTFVDNIRACSDELYVNHKLEEHDADSIDYKVTAETNEIFRLEFTNFDLGSLGYVTFKLTYTVDTNSKQCRQLKQDFFELVW